MQTDTSLPNAYNKPQITPIIEIVEPNDITLETNDITLEQAVKPTPNSIVVGETIEELQPNGAQIVTESSENVQPNLQIQSEDQVVDKVKVDTADDCTLTPINNDSQISTFSLKGLTTEDTSSSFDKICDTLDDPSSYHPPDGLHVVVENAASESDASMNQETEHEERPHVQVSQAETSHAMTTEQPLIRTENIAADVVAKADKSQKRQKSGSNVKRSSAIREIIDSEKTYVNQLRDLDEYYISPLHNKDSKEFNLLSVSQKAKIFACISSLKAINETLLVDFGREPDITKVLTVLKRTAPFLKIYGAFINNYTASVNALDKERSSNKKFKQYLESARKRLQVIFATTNIYIQKYYLYIFFVSNHFMNYILESWEAIF